MKKEEKDNTGCMEGVGEVTKSEEVKRGYLE